MSIMSGFSRSMYTRASPPVFYLAGILLPESFSPLSVGSPPLVPDLHKLPDRRVGDRQCFFIWQEDNSKVLCPRFLPEAGTVDHHHVLLQNKFLHEHFVAFRNVDSGICIERAARRDAAYPRCRIAPFDSKIPAAAKLLSNFNQVILRALQCGLDRILFGMI